MSKVNTIIFSPHIDDEVLGCFSWLKPGSLVLVAGVEDRPGIPASQRIAEIAAASDELGFEWKLLNNRVNAYQADALITPFEDAINLHKPERVLIPEPSYNQDHRAVYDAGIVATRPHDRNWFVDQVLIFEQPHSVMWPHTTQPATNTYVEIDINEKLDAYALYTSQIRGHRSPETIKALAGLRGAQINAPFAEAFYAKRLMLRQLSQTATA